jgi:hypothetical protein
VAPALAVEGEGVVGEAAAQVPAAQALALVRAAQALALVRAEEEEVGQAPVRGRGLDLGLARVRGPEPVREVVAEAHRRCRQYEPFGRSASGDSRRSALDLSAPADPSPACGRSRSKVPGWAAGRSLLPLQAMTWREAILD